MNCYFPEAWASFQEKRAPFMYEMFEDMEKRRPYAGLKILHNLPLTLSVLLKIDCLLMSNAKITITMPKFVKPDLDVINIIKNSPVNFIKNHSFSEKYDVLLDCCGELSEITTPTIGAVEITKTGADKYRKIKLDYPVISVDDSKLKFLEDSIGSVDGLLRALNQLIHEDLRNKKYVVFGFGKIGFGIAKMLLSFSDDVVVIDTMKNALNSAKMLGCITLHTHEKKLIHEKVRDAFCIITATGDKGFISREYDHHQFKNKYLVNVGAEDEFGTCFTEHEVFNKKMPVNFLLKEPTKIEYLDPAFYAHNFCIDLLLNNKFTSNVHKLPDSVDNDILNRWFEKHGQDQQEFNKVFDNRYS